MDEVSKLSTYEQVPKFASGRDVFHGTMQASATTKKLAIELFRSVSRQESNPWGSVLRVICVGLCLKATRGVLSVLRVICVTIEQSAAAYNRGCQCTIAQWLRRSLLPHAAAIEVLS
jgi:hypothetical protein